LEVDIMNMSLPNEISRLLQGIRVTSIATALAACGGGAAAGGGGVSGCGGDTPGGLNPNQKGVGDQPGGVELSIGDIAVAPSGEFVVFQRGEDLAIGWPATGRIEVLPVRLPTRLAFAKTRPVVYVGSRDDGMVHAVDVERRLTLWTAPVGDTDAASGGFRISSSKGDTRVVAASAFEVDLLDAATGELVAHHTAASVVDVAMLPDDARALVVPLNTWQGMPAVPRTRVMVLDLEDGQTRTFDVPNCSDRIIVTPDGERAFLAPTGCSQVEASVDPISYIDIRFGKEAFVKNLPGFGPLAIGPEGNKAVGFFDATQADPSLFEEPSQIPPASPRYHMMVLDVATLAYSFHPIGDELPRYALAPNGQVLLVDTLTGTPAALFDTTTGERREIEGASLSLQNFVISSDSAHSYVLQNGLNDVDLAKASSTEIPTGFLPLNINIAPDDETLFLRKSEAEICVFSLDIRSCGANLVAAHTDP
jgi:hypothetical protein